MISNPTVLSANKFSVIVGRLITALCMTWGVALYAIATPLNSPAFNSSIQPISKEVEKEMRKFTWHPGCPVALNQLAYIRLSYWGFDNESHQGVLVVHKKIAKEVVSIFKELYEYRYPIQRMQPMDVFNGNDNASMAANNTSAFICRDTTNKPGIFSKHSYGLAIDINPLINPFVTPKEVLPPQGATYINRHKPYPGKLIKNDYIYNLFIQKGWKWGGLWHNLTHLTQ